MPKTYTFEEFRWKFLSKEVDRFDLRKISDRVRYKAKQLYDLGRRVARESLEPWGETREVREGSIVRILQIKDIHDVSGHGAFYSLNKPA